MSTHMIRLKLDADAIAEDLSAVAVASNRAATAAVRCWQRWWEDHPDWVPTPKEPARRGAKKGQQALKPDGTPYLEHQSGPLALGRDMYRRAVEVSPEVNSQIIASGVSAVWDNLRSNVPYDHPGEARYRWQAILRYEMAVPAYRSLAVPLHNRIMCLAFDDSGWRLLVSLFSKRSGRQTGVAIPLVSAGLTAGQKRILMRVARRDDGWRHKDSKLVAKESSRGKLEWFLHLVYRRPAIATLDTSRTATLWPAPPEWNHLFALELPDGTVRRFGQVVPFAAEYRRLTLRKKAIQFRHRDGAAKGRGRRRVLGRIKPIGRAMRDLQDRVCKLAVADAMRILTEANVGTLVWREPSRGLRNMLRVAKDGLPWDWTAFAGKLAFKMQLLTGELAAGAKHRVMKDEHQEKFGWGESKEVDEAVV